MTPNASADAIGGVEERADGSAVLTLKTRAVPDKGRANKSVVAILAKTLGLPRSALALTSGTTARTKTVRIAADPRTVAAALDALAAKPDTKFSTKSSTR